MNLSKLIEKQNREFEEKFDKPLSDEVVRLYHLPGKSHVYLDNTDIKSHINKVREETLQFVREELSDLATGTNSLNKKWRCCGYHDVADIKAFIDEHFVAKEEKCCGCVNLDCPDCIDGFYTKEQVDEMRKEWEKEQLAWWVEKTCPQHSYLSKEQVLELIGEIELPAYDHSKCPIKETCIGYQSAESDLDQAKQEIRNKLKEL